MVLVAVPRVVADVDGLMITFYVRYRQLLSFPNAPSATPHRSRLADPRATLLWLEIPTPLVQTMTGCLPRLTLVTITDTAPEADVLPMRTFLLPLMAEPAQSLMMSPPFLSVENWNA